MARSKLIFLLMGLVSSFPAFALNAPGGIGSVTVCNQVLPTATTIHLQCRLNSSSNRCTAHRAGDNAATPSDYSAGKGMIGGINAANGKTFVVDVMQVMVFSGGTTPAGAEPWYSDNDLGDTSAGTFTNGVNIFGITNGNGYTIQTQNSDSANNSMSPGIVHCMNNVNWNIPNGKFPGWKGDGSAGFIGDYWGHEK